MLIYNILRVCFCICSLPRDFLEAPPIVLDYFGCVAMFNHILLEQRIFNATAQLDKLIVFDMPLSTGSAWTQFGRVPLSEILIFLDNLPQFFDPYRLPQPFAQPASSPPPPPTPAQAQQQQQQEEEQVGIRRSPEVRASSAFLDATSQCCRPSANIPPLIVNGNCDTDNNLNSILIATQN